MARATRTGFALVFLQILMLPAAWAASDAEPASDDFWTRKALLGDAGGLRSAIQPFGLSLAISETSEVLGNFTGGIRRGAIYEGLTDASLQFDLQTKFEWPGVIFARAFQIHGRGLSATNLENLITVSSIEALPATRLFELWYEHYATDRLRIKIGQQAADQEFLTSATAKLFINATFGWPTLPAVDLPSGGPAYPLGTPAVRLRVDPTDEFVLLGGVFNVDPAGPGAALAQVRDPSGTNSSTGDGVLALVEAQYSPKQEPWNGTYKLGAWYHSERFPDQRFDTAGVSLASPLSNGMPRLLGNNYGIYGIVDQPLFRKGESNTGPVAFVRAMGAPGDRNLVNFYIDAGLAYNGPFERDDDIVGIGFGYARIGNPARGLDRDTASFSGQPYPLRSAEAVLELSYQFNVTPWWQVQPDFQYIFNPGGGIPNPAAPGQKIGSAAILGLRTVIVF